MNLINIVVLKKNLINIAGFSYDIFFIGTIQVKELMEGEMGKTARKNVKEYAEMAREALAQGTGSSWKNLSLLIEELCKIRETNDVNKLSSHDQRAVYSWLLFQSD